MMNSTPFETSNSRNSLKSLCSFTVLCPPSFDELQKERDPCLWGHAFVGRAFRPIRFLVRGKARDLAIHPATVRPRTDRGQQGGPLGRYARAGAAFRSSTQ